MGKTDSKDRAARKEIEKKVDEQIAESFPASDPPSYAGGMYGVGAPARARSKVKRKPARRA